MTGSRSSHSNNGTASAFLLTMLGKQLFFLVLPALGGSLSKTAAKRHDSGIEPFRSTAVALKNKGFDFGAHDPTIVPRPPGCMARGTMSGLTPNPDETHLHPQLAEGPAPNKGGI